MDSPERRRSYGKQDVENNSDVKSDRGGNDEGWDGSDKRKHRSNKTRRPSGGEEAERPDGSGRRSSGDKNESRKRSNDTGRAGSDEDVYDTKREHSKQIKKSKEESSLEKLSSWYQDGELENKQDGRDKSGNRGHGGADENERRKTSSKFSDHESSQSRSRSKEERSRDGEREKMAGRDSRSLDMRESNREKGHMSSEQARNPRKRWDESDVIKKAEESSYEITDTKMGKSSESKRENARETSLSARIEPNEGKNRGLDLDSDKSVKSSNKEERRVDAERTKSGRSDGQGEDNKASPKSREDRLGKEKNEKYRQQKTPIGRDAAESREKVFHY